MYTSQGKVNSNSEELDRNCMMRIVTCVETTVIDKGKVVLRYALRGVIAIFGKTRSAT